MSHGESNARDVDKMTIEAALHLLREQAPARIAGAYRDLMKDKSYQLYPMGTEAAAYLRSKRKVLTDDSYRDYEASLDKLARFFPDLELGDFEPPVGTRRIEEFLEDHYGRKAPRTYNKHLSILRDFFKWLIVHERRLTGDPTLAITRAKARGVYRTTFNDDACRAIVASAVERRDRIALRLLINYGLRKGTLRKVQFMHFDFQRRELAVFIKGGKVRQLPIPDEHLWSDLERLILDWEADPKHFLMATTKGNGKVRKRIPTQPMGDHAMHDWWYRRLEAAGVVREGTTNGEKMHKARHTAGQRVLDETGNLKAAQELLMHTSMQTTGDIYTDWSIDQLRATLITVQSRRDGHDI